MKNKDVAAVAAQLVEALPDFAIRGAMLFRVSIDQVLSGLYFESDRSDADLFFVWAFAVPMFVPTDHIYFNFGYRLRHGQKEVWSKSDPSMADKLKSAIRQQALPFLDRTRDSAGILQEAMTRRHPHNVHGQETIALTLAHAGRFEEALAELEVLLQNIDPAIRWHEPIRLRALQVRKLLQNNKVAVPELLSEWRAENLVTLGLTKFAL